MKSSTQISRVRPGCLARGLLVLGLTLAGTAAAGAVVEERAAAPAAEGSPPASDAAGGRYDRRLELPKTPAYFDDANRLPPMIPIQVQPQPVRNSRSMVWIGGLIVLVAVFLWNRSRRLELERMESASSRDEREGKGGEVIDITSAMSPPPIDEDSDDLAAAARAQPASDSPQEPSAAKRPGDAADSAEDSKEEPR